MLTFLTSYPEAVLTQVQSLIAQGRLAEVLAKRYPQMSHDIQNDKSLYQFTQELKQRFVKSSPPVSKVCFDAKIHLDNSLGLHSFVSRVQGGKLKAKQEIRISALFKQLPLALLKMVVVHELAHLREKDHNKAFYQLCQHMEPQYHQLEFDLRLFLTLRQLEGKAL
ncbi:M48 family metallopeptidase [Rheinheimera sp.]|uniref:M48 metallopeptidase family protein n=1 Tax=Rheinheimera sp. TaxID=1869214 RepID=UPI002614B156|nr:YgjP-like metallopeptidase domain-containing protein [Rheinheimera sp.]MCA1928292.1 DUF45 domain-containing protein [Rheinheimera sp.]